MMAWDSYALCECGWFAQAFMGEKVHTHRQVCPRCGAGHSNWRIVTGRWVSRSRWWWPPSWGLGHFEHKEEE